MTRLLILFSILGFLADLPEDVRTRVYRIDQLYYESQYEEAIEQYGKIMDEYPILRKDPEILVKLGRSYARLGDDEKAHSYFTLAIDEAPDGSYASQAVSALASIYSQKYEYDKVVEVCGEIARKHPNTEAAATALYYVGSYLYLQGRKEDALKTFEKFIRDYPSSIYRESAISSVVELYISENELDKAEAVLNKFMAERSGNTGLAVYLGDIYARQGRFDDAIRLLELARQAEPTDMSLIEKLGEIHLRRGDRQKALETWRQILNVTSYTESYRHQRLASILKSNKMYDLAVEEYEAALADQPLSSYLYSQIADIYKIKGDTKKAVQTYMKAIVNLGMAYTSRDRMINEMMEIVPEGEADRVISELVTELRAQQNASANDASYRLAVGELLFHRGDYVPALQEFSSLSKTYNDQGGIIRHYAAKLASKGEHGFAILYYEKVLELFPVSAYLVETSMALARECMNFGRPDKAEDVLLSLVNRGFVSPQIYELLGEIQLEGGKVEAALDTFARMKSYASGESVFRAQARMAECLALLGRFDEAETEANELAGQQKAPPSLVHGAKGRVLFWQGRFDDAAAEFAQAISSGVGPDERESLAMMSLIKLNADFFYDPLAAFVEGWRYEKTGDPVKALTSYGLLINRYPNAAIVDDAKLRMALVLDAMGNTGEAKHILEQLVSSGRTLSPRAQMIIGNMQYSINPKKAIDSYSRLIEMFPASSLTPFARRKIRELVGEVETVPQGN